MAEVAIIAEATVAGTGEVVQFDPAEEVKRIFNGGKPNDVGLEQFINKWCRFFFSLDPDKFTEFVREFEGRRGFVGSVGQVAEVAGALETEVASKTQQTDKRWTAPHLPKDLRGCVHNLVNRCVEGGDPDLSDVRTTAKPDDEFALVTFPYSKNSDQRTDVTVALLHKPAGDPKQAGFIYDYYAELKTEDSEGRRATPYWRETNL